MATPVTKTVKPSGGDYSSLAAFDAGEARNLVTADEIAIASIEGDWSGGPDTAAVELGTDWTTDSTRYIEIKADSANHTSGVWDSNKYILKGESVHGVIRLQASHVKIRYIQIECNRTTVATKCFRPDGNPVLNPEYEFEAILAKGTGANPSSNLDCFLDLGTVGDNTTIKMWNCIAHNFYHGIRFSAGGNITLIAYNNTLYDLVNYGILFNDSATVSTVRLKNNIIGNGSQANYSLSGVSTLQTVANISMDQTSPDGQDYRQKVPMFAQYQTKDFRLSRIDKTTHARNHGADLSADPYLAFNTDISGRTRPVAGTWDIGASEAPARSKRTVKPSGGDYTSLSAWEAGEAADLVTADHLAMASIEGDWSGGPDTTYCAIDDAAWVTDAQRRIWICCNEATAAHTGKWNTDKYILEVASQWNGALFIDTDYVTVEGLQIANDWTDATTGNVMGIRNNAMGDEIFNNIIRWTGGGTPDSVSDAGIQQDGCADGVHRMWNNIIYDWYVGIYYDYGGTGNTFVIYNNTLVDNVNRGIQIEDSAGDVALYLKNNICNGNPTDYAITSFTTYVHSNNLSEDTSSPDSAYRSKAVDFIDEANDDYRISVDDTDAKGAGAWLSWDLQLPWQEDINGKVRDDSMAWDIGADQFEQTVVEKTIMQSGGDYTSLAAFEAGERQDLVHTGIILEGKIDGAWTVNDTTKVLFQDSDGWCTAKGNYIRVYTTPTARHRGRPSISYLQHYRLITVGTYYDAIRAWTHCIRFEGLEVQNTTTTAAQIGSCISLGTSGLANGKFIDLRATECLIHNALGGAGNTGSHGIACAVSGISGAVGQYVLVNNIIYGNEHDGIHACQWQANMEVIAYNNTCYKNGRYGIHRAIATSMPLYVKNNLCDQNVTADYLMAYTASATNVSGDGSSPERKNQTPDYIDPGEYTTGYDYRINGEDTSSIDQGTDLSADAKYAFNTDILGNTRSGTWDAGAREYIGSVITRTIATSGGDYSDVDAFEAGEADDLVYAGTQVVAEISGTGVSENQYWFRQADGWYTGKGNGIKITTLDDGARHHGKWTTSAYRVVGASNGVVTSMVKEFWLDGLQIHLDGSNSGDNGIWITNSLRHNIKISNCIIKGNDTAGGGQYGYYLASARAGAEYRLWNNIIYGFTGAGSGGPMQIGGTNNLHYMWVYNNTCYGGITGILSGAALAEAVLKNNIVQGAGTDYSGTFDAASDSNLASDATAPGSNPQNNKSLQFVGFEFDDYRIIPQDTDAIDNGVDLSADSAIAFNTDIDGHTRGATWDIGASEVVTPAMRSKTIRESGGDYSSFNAFLVGEEADLVHDAVYLVATISGAWSADDTTQADCTGTGWVTTSANYIKVEATGAGKHSGGIWTSTAYRLVVNGVCVNLTDGPLKHIWLKHLQIHKNNTAANSAVQFNVNVSGTPSPSICQVEGCIIKGGGVGAAGNHAGIDVSWNYGYNQIVKAWNNVIYDFGATGYKECAIKIRKAIAFLYNNTLAKSRYGIYDDGNGSDIIAKNNISQAAGTTPIDYVNSFNVASTDNLSGDATAPGSNPEINKTLTFKNKAADNYNLITTDPARDKGADLSADADLAFNTDLSGRTRVVPWDIGALEYSENGGEGDDASVALVSSVMRRNARRRLMYADD